MHNSKINIGFEADQSLYVMYKIVSKVISNRLKSILPCIILLNQSVFVPGWLTTNTTLLAYELKHFLQTKKRRGGELCYS